MMDTQIQKQIIDYFSYFDEFNTAAKSSLRECQNYAETINNLITRYKNIKQAEVAGTPLADFEDLQSKLCAYINNQISGDISEIYTRHIALEELFEQLSNKNRVLRNSCREIVLDENSPIVKGSPTQPTLQQLLEYADDTITFASQVCAQIETALNIIATTRLNTNSFGEHFCYPRNWYKRITEIITYTSFLSGNQA